LAISPIPNLVPGRAQSVEFRQVLFVSLEAPIDPDDTVTREPVERTVRALVERQYARHGIPSVDYDLQLLL
jgi:hypothetical protein